jgi:hypothetical protein
MLVADIEYHSVKQLENEPHLVASLSASDVSMLLVKLGRVLNDNYKLRNCLKNNNITIIIREE